MPQEAVVVVVVLERQADQEPGQQPGHLRAGQPPAEQGAQRGGARLVGRRDVGLGAPGPPLALPPLLLGGLRASSMRAWPPAPPRSARLAPARRPGPARPGRPARRRRTAAPGATALGHRRPCGVLTSAPATAAAAGRARRWARAGWCRSGSVQTQATSPWWVTMAAWQGSPAWSSSVMVQLVVAVAEPLAALLPPVVGGDAHAGRLEVGRSCRPVPPARCRPAGCARPAPCPCGLAE